MSTTPPTWQSQYYIMLLHPMEARILLLPSQHGWCLPSFHQAEPLNESEGVTRLRQISNVMQQQLGLNAITLYCSYHHVDHENAQHELMYVLEIPDSSWMPPEGSQWVGQDTLTHLELMHSEQRTVIATCLLEDEEIPPLRSLWARRGWFAETEAWIREQLALLNYTLVAPIEQVRTWGLSCVLRVPTTHGNFYFKAILTSSEQKNTPVVAGTSSEVPERLPLFFTHEPMLIQSLAAWYPQNVPSLLAIEREHRWMLLTEFGTVLFAHSDKTVWEKALAVYGHMQVASIQYLDSLFAIGCIDRRLHILEAQIDPLFKDEEVLANLNSSEVELLRTYGPQLKTMCQQLAHYPIPQTLVHGDLHTGNIAVQNDTIIYFDWTDGCVAHPFFDALTFLDNIHDPVEQRHMRDIYLVQWTEYASLESLREVFPLSQILAAIHQVVSYQHIMAHVDNTTRQDMRGGAAYWLRKLLQLLAETV